MRLCTRVTRGRFSALCALAAVVTVGGGVPLHAAERVLLRNGFAVSCDHRAPLDAGHVRLYLDATSTSYMDVDATEIAGAELDAAVGNAAVVSPVVADVPGKAHPAEAGARPMSLHEEPRTLEAMIASAGAARSLNVDLLRSVVNAESGGHARAVSRAGAQGLMQLMPATARSLGVADSFEPEANLRGGTDYLDSLLRRYHDDLPLALAAYNAGPGAVDRYHGVPPYRETRLYVARIIGEFNRRTLLARQAAMREAALEVAAAR